MSDSKNIISAMIAGSRDTKDIGEKLKMIEMQKKMARKQGIAFKDISISTRKDKKYAITLPNGKVINYGSLGMSDYLIHGDEERRRRFHQRFRGNKAYNDPTSGLYYSRHLLWN